jgi:hypothetical protein
MFRSYIFRALILPLSGASVSFFALAFVVCPPWRDLFINISAGLLGSVVTVAYIDNLIARDRRAQREAVRQRIAVRLLRLANQAATSVRSAFHIGTDVLRLITTDDQAEMRDGMIDVIEEHLRPATNAVLSMSQGDWETLAINLQGISIQSDQFMGLFGRDLEPDMFKHLLDLQAVCERIVLLYRTFPDLFGVPLDQLEPLTDGSSAIPLQSRYNGIAMKELDDLLGRCVDLLGSLQLERPTTDNRTHA